MLTEAQVLAPPVMFTLRDTRGEHRKETVATRPVEVPGSPGRTTGRTQTRLIQELLGNRCDEARRLRRAEEACVPRRLRAVGGYYS